MFVAIIVAVDVDIAGNAAVADDIAATVAVAIAIAIAATIVVDVAAANTDVAAVTALIVASPLSKWHRSWQAFKQLQLIQASNNE